VLRSGSNHLGERGACSQPHRQIRGCTWRLSTWHGGINHGLALLGHIRASPCGLAALRGRVRECVTSRRRMSCTTTTACYSFNTVQKNPNRYEWNMPLEPLNIMHKLMNIMHGSRYINAFSPFASPVSFLPRANPYFPYTIQSKFH
jgi:hypothetical protein